MAERLRRYVHVVVNFVGVGSSPTECNIIFFRTKKHGGTGIRARVKRITTAYANHYTIPPVSSRYLQGCFDSSVGRALD
jgi:hypothetical protein